MVRTLEDAHGGHLWRLITVLKNYHSHLMGSSIFNPCRPDISGKAGELSQPSSYCAGGISQAACLIDNAGCQCLSRGPRTLTRGLQVTKKSHDADAILHSLLSCKHIQKNPACSKKSAAFDALTIWYDADGGPETAAIRVQQMVCERPTGKGGMLNMQNPNSKSMRLRQLQSPGLKRPKFSTGRVMSLTQPVDLPPHTQTATAGCVL